MSQCGHEDYPCCGCGIDTYEPDTDPCPECGEMILGCICEHTLDTESEECPWCGGEMNDEGWCEYCADEEACLYCGGDCPTDEDYCCDEYAADGFEDDGQPD